MTTPFLKTFPYEYMMMAFQVYAKGFSGGIIERGQPLAREDIQYGLKRLLSPRNTEKGQGIGPDGVLRLLTRPTAASLRRELAVGMYV